MRASQQVLHNNYHNADTPIDSADTDTIELHSSCTDLEDGLYYIKPTLTGLVCDVIRRRVEGEDYVLCQYILPSRMDAIGPIDEIFLAQIYQW